MPRPYLTACAATIVLATAACAQSFEFEVQLFGCEARVGPPKLVSAPTLVAKSGESCSLLVGGQVAVGKAFRPVGREIDLTATLMKGGAIEVKLEFAHHRATGGAGAIQTTTAKNQRTEIVQSGQRIRIDLKDAPNERYWAEITVKAK